MSGRADDATRWKPALDSTVEYAMKDTLITSNKLPGRDTQNLDGEASEHASPPAPGAVSRWKQALQDGEREHGGDDPASAPAHTEMRTVRLATLKREYLCEPAPSTTNAVAMQADATPAVSSSSSAASHGQDAEDITALAQQWCARLAIGTGPAGGHSSAMLDISNWVPGCVVHLERLPGCVKVSLRITDARGAKRVAGAQSRLGEALKTVTGLPVEMDVVYPEDDA